jgi:hypothetical protein
VSERSPANKRPRHIPTAQLTETITRILHPTVFETRPWEDTSKFKFTCGARYALPAAHWGPDTRVAISLYDHEETEEFFDSVHGLEFEKRMESLSITYQDDLAWGPGLHPILKNDKKMLFDWISSCERLETLRLKFDATRLPPNVTNLSRLTCLTSLHLDHVDFGDNIQPLFEGGFKYLTNLRDLTYRGYNKIATSALTGLQSLTHLALACHEVDSYDFSFLTNLKKLGLMVDICDVTQLNLPTACLEKLRCVVTLGEAFLDNGPGAMGTGSLFGCTNLHTLSVFSIGQESYFPGIPINVPTGLAGLRSLQVLQIGSKRDDSVIKLPRIQLPALREITLWGGELRSEFSCPERVSLTFSRGRPPHVLSIFDF